MHQWIYPTPSYRNQKAKAMLRSETAYSSIATPNVLEDPALENSEALYKHVTCFIVS